MTSMKTIYPRQWVELPNYSADGTVSDDDPMYRVDLTFMMSTYRCTWGRGCLGTGPSKHGCCDNPAWMDEEDVKRVDPFAARIGVSNWYTKVGNDKYRTRVKGGKCIMLGPDGCKLHKEAVDRGEDYRDSKPSICWQVPIWTETSDDGEHFIISNWEDSDWWGQNDWLCTADPANYAFDFANEPIPYVWQTFEPELRRIMGDKSYEMLASVCRKQAAMMAGSLREGKPVAVKITRKPVTEERTNVIDLATRS